MPMEAWMIAQPVEPAADDPDSCQTGEVAAAAAAGFGAEGGECY